MFGQTAGPGVVVLVESGVLCRILGTWYLVVAYRGNGGIHRGIYQLQGDDNGHVSIQYSVIFQPR